MSKIGQASSDTFWQRAIKAAPSDFYRIINTRGYADFLFRQGRHEQGRRSYQQALDILNNDTDFNKSVNGYTYQMWMVSEAAHRFNEEAETYYTRAKRLLDSVSHPVMKQNDLNRLEKAREGVFGTVKAGLEHRPMPAELSSANLAG